MTCCCCAAGAQHLLSVMTAAMHTLRFSMRSANEMPVTELASVF